MPPPAEASTVFCLASSCAFSICSCSCCACCIMAPRSKPPGNRRRRRRQPPPPPCSLIRSSPRRRRSDLSRCRRSGRRAPCAPGCSSASLRRRSRSSSTLRSSTSIRFSVAGTCVAGADDDLDRQIFARDLLERGAQLRQARSRSRSAAKSLSKPSERCTSSRASRRDCARSASSGSISVTASMSSVKLCGAGALLRRRRAARSERLRGRAGAQSAPAARARTGAQPTRARAAAAAIRAPPPFSTRDSSASSLSSSAPIGSSGSTRVSAIEPDLEHVARHGRLRHLLGDLGEALEQAARARPAGTDCAALDQRLQLRSATRRRARAASSTARATTRSRRWPRNACASCARSWPRANAASTSASAALRVLGRGSRCPSLSRSVRSATPSTSAVAASVSPRRRRRDHLIEQRQRVAHRAARLARRPATAPPSRTASFSSSRILARCSTMRRCGTSLKS